MDVFTGDFYQCDHSNQNLMVSKNFYSRPYKIEAMEVRMIMDAKATTVAYADKKSKKAKPLQWFMLVKGLPFNHQNYYMAV